MSKVIPFDTAGVPAHLASLFGDDGNKDLMTASTGYPSISIKGKVFHIVRGQERELIMNRDGDPVSKIEVVIVRANPNRSKVFYLKGYEDGSDARPDCYSNDGVAPAMDAEHPQSKKCDSCKHNQWGSRITDSGSKGKACSDSQRLAVASPKLINDPMLLRVPAASLKACSEFAQSLEKRNVPYQAVVVKVAFDHEVAHPQLMFSPVGFIDAETAAEVKEVAESDVVKHITGLDLLSPDPDAEPGSDNEEFQQTAAPTPTPTPKPSPTPSASAFGDDDDEEEEAVIEEKPKKKKAAAKKKEPVTVDAEVETVGSDNLVNEISNVLGELGYDDE